MSYITKQGLIDRFGETELIQLTDRTNRPATTIDDIVVERAISDAAGEINSYLKKRYRLPLARVPDILAKRAADIARYFLHGKAADKDSPVTVAYRDALKWLEAVAKGIAEIDDGGETPRPAGAGSVQTSAPNRRFTRNSLRGL